MGLYRNRFVPWSEVHRLTQHLPELPYAQID